MLRVKQAILNWKNDINDVFEMLSDRQLHSVLILLSLLIAIAVMLGSVPTKNHESIHNWELLKTTVVFSGEFISENKVGNNYTYQCEECMKMKTERDY